MGIKKYPPLSVSEIVSILQRAGFSYKRSRGDHDYYEIQPTAQDPQRRLVTVDSGARQFDDFLLKSMIDQSGLSREAFYGATKKTAAKIGVPAW